MAGAQTTPPPPPMPPTAPPAPKAPPAPPAPWIPDLPAIHLLQDGQLRLLDESRLMALDGQLIARDAMEQARFALEDARLGFQDQAFRLSTTYRGDSGYNAGKDAMSQGKYDDAIKQFDRVVAQKGANADGAAFWKAYSQFKLGKSDDAVATVAALRKDFPQSRYLNDAKVLEADAKRMAGQPVNPASADNDELKLLAINGIKNTDPERAIPLLEGVLSATNSLKVKKQALYVLASMTKQPRAHQILLSYAKGGGNPDLQIEAIRYLAANSDKQTTAAELMQIYQATQDTDVRLAVIGALRSSGNGSSLISIASSNQNPVVIRSSALNGLSGLLGPTELWTLYEKETNKDLRLQILSVFGSMQATEQLTRAIRGEKDQDIVRRAIRSLGNQPASKTGQVLVDLYGTEQDQETRRAVINALANQNNAEGLVAIARKESSLPLKTSIVRQLSEMAPKSKVAADYLMEIIK
jgi:HEAT repeat protein